MTSIIREMPVISGLYVGSGRHLCRYLVAKNYRHQLDTMTSDDQPFSVKKCAKNSIIKTSKTKTELQCQYDEE